MVATHVSTLLLSTLKIYGKTVLSRNTITELSIYRGKNVEQAIQMSQTKKYETQIGAAKIMTTEYVTEYSKKLYLTS